MTGLMYGDKPVEGYLCPYTGMKKACSKINARCPKWILVRGTDPQTGREVDNWDCADRWGPSFQIALLAELRAVSAELGKTHNLVARSQGPVGPCSPISPGVRRLETALAEIEAADTVMPCLADLATGQRILPDGVT